MLRDFLNVWEEQQSAVSAIMASGGFPKQDPNSKQAKPAKPGTGPPDVESTLPGPSKITLDAILRILSMSLLHSEFQQILPSIILENGSTGVLPIMRLMQHYSPRVQYRAVQLVVLLMQYEGVRLKMIEQESVQALLSVVANSNSACVRLAAIQVGHEYTRILQYHVETVVLPSEPHLAEFKVPHPDRMVLKVQSKAATFHFPRDHMQGLKYAYKHCNQGTIFLGCLLHQTASMVM